MWSRAEQQRMVGKEIGQEFSFLKLEFNDDWLENQTSAVLELFGTTPQL